jgi:hypothetical protein
VKGGALAACIALFAGCGATQEEPRAPHQDAPRNAVAREEERAPDPAPVEQAPPPACSDEGCFQCGSGFCPVGFYCDETANGGPACGWVPDCARKAGCECVGRALGGARCQSEGGGAHVK